MTERAEPPMTFGGTGGLVWRLRPDDGALATTRRSRPDPSAPDALRPPALGPPTRLASCGRRWDTALSPERVELAAALASRVADRALASAASAPRSRVRDAVPDPADVPSDADSDSDSDSDSDDARPDYRLDYETFEARAALLRGHAPRGRPPPRAPPRRRRIPRRVPPPGSVRVCQRARRRALARPRTRRGRRPHPRAHWRRERRRAPRHSRSPSPTRPATRRPDPRFARSARGGSRPAPPRNPYSRSNSPPFRTARDGSGRRPRPAGAVRDARSPRRGAVRGGRRRRNPPPRGQGRAGAPGRRARRATNTGTRGNAPVVVRARRPRARPRGHRAQSTRRARDVGGVRERRVASRGRLRRFWRGRGARHGERPGDWDGDGWSGCAYAAHPRALSATPRTEVRWLIFARGDGAGDVIATRDATRRAWRAMAASPAACRGRPSPPSGARRSRVSATPRACATTTTTTRARTTARARASEDAFALACDETVELGDLRRPATPAAAMATRLRRRARVVARGPDGGARGTRPRATEMEGVVGESVVGAREIHREVHPGSSSREVPSRFVVEVVAPGIRLRGAASGGGVVAYEFAGDGDAVRALSAGTRVPTISGRDGTTSRGWRSSRRSRGDALDRGRWCGRRREAARRASARRARGADEDAARTPIVFDESNANDAADGDGVSRRDDDEGRTRVGRRRRENAGSDDETAGDENVRGRLRRRDEKPSPRLGGGRARARRRGGWCPCRAGRWCTARRRHARRRRVPSAPPRRRVPRRRVPRRRVPSASPNPRARTPRPGPARRARRCCTRSSRTGRRRRSRRAERRTQRRPRHLPRHPPRRRRAWFARGARGGR